MTGAADTNSIKGPIQPWLRSFDGFVILLLVFFLPLKIYRP